MTSWWHGQNLYFMMQVFYNSTILVVQNSTEMERWRWCCPEKYRVCTWYLLYNNFRNTQRPIKHTRVDLFHYMYIGHNGISTIHTKFTAICRSVSILSNYSLLSRLFCKKSTPVLVPPVPAVCAKIPKREQNTWKHLKVNTTLSIGCLLT